MYGNHTVGVVVPAYNEEGLVGRTVEKIPPFVDRIYVVDDASTDDTWTEIRHTAGRINDRGSGVDDESPRDGDSPHGMGGVPSGGSWGPDGSGRSASSVDSEGSASSVSSEGSTGAGGQSERAETRASFEPGVGGSAVGPRVVPIRHEENRGVGGAIKSGYRRAHSDGIDVVAVIAGDDQMDSSALASLVEPIVEGRADYVKGNRLLSRESRTEVPRFRLFGNVLLSLLTKISSGYWTISDSQNGYTAISRDALEAADFEEMYEFYGYCNDLLVKLNVEGLTVVDVPTPISYGDETSHISYRSYVPRVSWMLLSNFLWRLKETYLVRDFHPLVLLYGLGIVAAGLSALRAAGALRSREIDRLPRAVESGVLATTLFVLAMIEDRAYNEDLDEQRRG